MRSRSPVAGWVGWPPLLLLPAVVMLCPSLHRPRWLWMWSLAVAIFVGCKWLTWRRTDAVDASLGRRAGYLLGWPGLDAGAFLSNDPLPASQRPTASEVGRALFHVMLGAGLFWLIARRAPVEGDLLRGWIGMVGLILMLHFGAFHLLSCAWRAAGVEARPLMQRPMSSPSLSEFWGRRWNTAFRDLTHRFLFRPLSRRLGPRGGIAVGFAFSGVIHDVVISLPAGGGWGGPTAYFLIQGGGLLVERSKVGRSLGLGRGWRGWCFTMGVLAMPVFWLFHPPFVRRIILPFMDAAGAW